MRQFYRTPLSQYMSSIKAWTRSNMQPKSHNTVSWDSLFLFNVNYKIESWPHGSEVTNFVINLNSKTIKEIKF